MDRKLLVEEVTEQLAAYILERQLKIGEKLPNEYELADVFNVGRSTVREAVKILVSKNMLEVRRGAGTYVVSTCPVEADPLGLSHIQDSYALALDLLEARLWLEPKIAAKAAEQAGKEDIKKLYFYCEEVEREIREGNDHMQADVRFHTCIARCSNNQVMENLIPIIHSAICTFVGLTHGQLKTETILTHRAIVDAIAERDSIGAECAMVMHLTYNRQRIKEIMKQKQEV